MDWVNIIGVVITTLATVVLAIFNIKYVRLVRKMLIYSHRPEIIVDYNWNKFREGGLSNDDFIMFLYVKNVGRGAAYNVEFVYDKSYELPILAEAGFTNRVLDNIKILHDGISILEQGGERTEIAFGGNTVKFNSLKRFWEEEKKRTNITVTYEDLEKVSYNQTLTIDFCRPNYSNEFNRVIQPQEQRKPH